MRHTTRIDIPKARRDKIIAILRGHLADGIDLMLQTKTAHWNVRGPQFIALHELFDKVAEGVEESVDEIAERIAQLGESVDGTARGVAASTALKAYPLNIADGLAHVAAVADALAGYAARVRPGIDETGKLGDAVTADLLTGVVRSTDKLLWFVEAHGQGD